MAIQMTTACLRYDRLRDCHSESEVQKLLYLQSGILLGLGHHSLGFRQNLDFELSNKLSLRQTRTENNRWGDAESKC